MRTEGSRDVVGGRREFGSKPSFRTAAGRSIGRWFAGGRTRRGVWAVAVLALSAAGTCGADVVVLTPVADNTMYMNASNPTALLSSGVGLSIFAGRTGGAATIFQRGLVRFDVSSIPCGATVTDVRLTLTLEQSGGSAATPIELHRASAAWGEGASNSVGGSGASSQPGDANWFERLNPGVLWATPGGDFLATTAGTTMVASTPGPVVWNSAGMIADVEFWRGHPASNFGWLMKGDEGTPNTARKFSSRETSTPGNAPALRIVYTPGTPLNISGQPQDVLMCPFNGEGFAVTAAGSGTLGYQWQIENASAPGGWENLSDGEYAAYRLTIAGSGTASLTVTPGSMSGKADFDSTHVRCVVSDSCGSLTSDPAGIRLCVADVNCDHSVDLNDFFDFLNCFDQTLPCADILGEDGTIDLNDFFGFLNAFDRSC